MPPPVFFCSIESEDHHENQKLSEILYNMSLEDPSLTVKENEETGQVLVSGLGELHLEILQDRILKEFKIKTELGPMRVAYRECVSDEIWETFTLQKNFWGKPAFAQLTLRISPVDHIYEVEEEDHSEEVSRSVKDIDGDRVIESFWGRDHGHNDVSEPYFSLDKVVEKVKLEDDEYLSSHMKRWQGVEFETWRSLDSIPLDQW